MKISIDDIIVRSGRREAVSESVEELARSIAEVGLLNPISVNSDHTLIAGLHRLEAARQLGWTEIECNVCELDEVSAELAEIDENFVRVELTTTQRGELLLRRKEIYETLHPETKHGMRNGQTSKDCNLQSLETKSFVQDTAEKMGISPATVSRQVQAAKNTTPEAKEILLDNNIDLTQQDALRLSHMEPEVQREVAEQLVSGKIASVGEFESAETITANLDSNVEHRRQESTSESSVQVGIEQLPMKEIETGRNQTVAEAAQKDTEQTNKAASTFANFEEVMQAVLEQIEPYENAVAELEALPTEEIDKISRQTDLVFDAVFSLVNIIEGIKEIRNECSSEE